MLSLRTLSLATFLVLLAVVFTGCSDQYAGRMAINGNVKLVGEPLKEGSISFEPLAGQDTQTGSGIQNGAYSIPRQNGLKPGKYLVRITAGDGKTPINEEEAGGPGGNANIVSVDLIPEDWNVNSKQQIDVTANGPNKFDFEIPQKNTPKKKKK